MRAGGVAATPEVLAGETKMCGGPSLGFIQPPRVIAAAFPLFYMPWGKNRPCSGLHRASRHSPLGSPTGRHLPTSVTLTPRSPPTWLRAPQTLDGRPGFSPRLGGEQTTLLCHSAHR